MTMIAHSREEIKNYVDTANDSILYALSAVIEAYEGKNAENPISKIENVKDLPIEIQRKIEKGRKDFEEGRVYTHKEVMDEVKQKYGL